MKAEQLRTEMLEKAKKNREDLAELRASLDTLRAVKRLPRITVLHQMASHERISQPGWDAYVRKHIVPYERVSLPPDEEVDIDLLTNKLLNKDVKFLPPPRQICRQNFFPSCDSSFVFGMTRPRALVCGARLPNTLIVALLWSSHTLGQVEAERRARRRRLYRQLRGEQDLGDLDFSSDDSLLSHIPNPHRRGGIGDVSEAELAVAEAVWTLQWEMAQPLRHRQRARPTKRKSRRDVQREKRGDARSRARSTSRRSRAGSRPRSLRPAARSASTDAPSTSRKESITSATSSKSHRRGTRAAPEPRPKPRTYSRAIPESPDDDAINRALLSLDNRPVFKNVVSMPSEHMLPSMFIGDYDEDYKRRATIFMREAQTKPWLLNLIPNDQRNSSLTPWQLNDIILNNMPRNNPKLTRRAILSIAKIVDEFSCKDLAALRQKMLDIMMENTSDSEVFQSALETLEGSLKMSSDELIPHLLAVYPLCPETTRGVIDAYLSRVGLIDPTGVLRRELISWVTSRGRSVSKTLRRKANHFLAQWRDSWECNARLVAEELRQDRLQAQVRADMVRALVRHEPSVVQLDDEDITLQLADHPSEHFAKSSTAIDVLNYFVEMSEPLTPGDWSEKQEPGKLPATKWYRKWRRHNKDLVCPERVGSALRGHPPPSAGLHQPTTLVTHVEGGLAPLPWPTGTLNVRLRVAAKFFYHGLGHGSDGDD